MYRTELLILLCLLCIILGFCLHILYIRFSKQRLVYDGLPIAKNVKVKFSKEITDLDMMTAIINLSKMKFQIDKTQNIDQREKFMKIMKDIIDEVYDDKK